MSSHPPTPSPRWLSEILDGSRTPPRPASSRCPYSRHLHPAVRWPSAETRWHPGHSQLALTPAGRLGVGRPAWPPTLDPTAAARSATEAHLPRHAPDSDPPRPRPYLALPSAGQRTADGWRGLVRRAVVDAATDSQAGPRPASAPSPKGEPLANGGVAALFPCGSLSNVCFVLEVL